MVSEVPERIDGLHRQHLEAKYGTTALNDREKLIDALISLIEHGRDQKQSLRSFLDHVAHQISRSLAFEEVIIGLYDRKERDFCHEVVFGYGDDIAAELKRLRYGFEDLVSHRRFGSVRIGKLSEFNPRETLSESELILFNAKSMGADARKPLDGLRQGDSIDTWMRCSRDNLVGWIRVSRPRNSKLPPKISVLWLELIASISACVISQRWQQEDKESGQDADES